MTIDFMRKMISDKYPFPKWQQRVATMRDNEVLAVYHSFLHRGLFNEPEERIPKELDIFDYDSLPVLERRPKGYRGEQLSLFKD